MPSATVKDPYHVVQSYLLQGNADTLITGFAAQIPYFAGVMDAGYVFLGLIVSQSRFRLLSDNGSPLAVDIHAR